MELSEKLHKVQKLLFQEEHMNKLEQSLKNYQVDSLTQTYKRFLIHQKAHYDLGFIIYNIFMNDQFSSTNSLINSFFANLNEDPVLNQVEPFNSDFNLQLPANIEELESIAKYKNLDVVSFICIPTIFHYFMSQYDCDAFISSMQENFISSPYFSDLVRSIFIIPDFIDFINIVFSPIISPYINEPINDSTSAIISSSSLLRWKQNAHRIPSIIRSLLMISLNPEEVLWSSFFEPAFLYKGKNSISLLQFYGFIDSYQQPNQQFLSQFSQIIHNNLHSFVEIISDPSNSSPPFTITEDDRNVAQNFINFTIRSTLDQSLENSFKTHKEFLMPEEYNIKFIQLNVSTPLNLFGKESSMIISPISALSQLLRLSDPIPKNLFQNIDNIRENFKDLFERKIVFSGDSKSFCKRSALFGAMFDLLSNYDKFNESLDEISKSDKNLLKEITSLTVLIQHVQKYSHGQSILLNFGGFFLMKDFKISDFSSLPEYIEDITKYNNNIRSSIAKVSKFDKINIIQKAMIITRNISFNDFLALRSDIIPFDIAFSQAISLDPISLINKFVTYSNKLHKVMETMPSIPECSELIERLLTAFRVPAPYQKMVIINEVFQDLYSLLEKMLPYGSEFGPDDKNSALLSIIIHANPPNFVSNLVFIETFAPLSPLCDEMTFPEWAPVLNLSLLKTIFNSESLIDQYLLKDFP